MFREKMHFIFNGQRSTDFGIINCAVDDGLFREEFLSNRSINELSVAGADTPYFEGVKREPRQLKLRFWMSESWDEKKINDIAEWLDVDYYQPLSFMPEDYVYYCIPVDITEIVHNGLKDGYLELNMRCDSPYKYSPITTVHQKVENYKTIEIRNTGRIKITPEITIVKKGDGDISLSNLSNFNGKPFTLTNLEDGETIIIDGEYETIQSNRYSNLRYENSNEEYLWLRYGVNRIKIEGSCQINFTYQCTHN
ncbi:phage tail family protein [Bacillus subtilis]|uniref:phage tail domain-containing protein n=1 Tax=Bacillus subtilis TaxID=1423 RepID=UPI002367F648|nr:phage tail domain-containing protein [Bacillus subtilis]WDI23845.1 phage tail family protein [Bacillus subtilis]